MTEEHLAALLATAEAGKKDKEGYQNLPEGRHVTLYVAFGGANLSVSRISGLKRAGDLVYARTVKGEEYLLSLADLYAGAVEPQANAARKAGFV